MCRLFWNLGASTSWNPQGLSRTVMVLLYLLLHGANNRREQWLGACVTSSCRGCCMALPHMAVYQLYISGKATPLWSRSFVAGKINLDLYLKKFLYCLLIPYTAQLNVCVCVCVCVCLHARVSCNMRNVKPQALCLRYWINFPVFVSIPMNMTFTFLFILLSYL